MADPEATDAPRTDPTTPEPPEPGEQADAAGASSAPQPDPDTPGAQEQRREARVINQFYGQVHAGQATFGISGGAAVSHVSVGRIPEAEVDHALRYFAPPDGYPQAAGLLDRERLVFLTGDPGVGRRTGALALLRERIGAEGRITGLSPAMTLAQLSEYDFVRGRGYLVLDWLGEKRDAAVQAFDAARLGDRLTDRGAFLVCTVNQRTLCRGDLEQRAVPWSPPKAGAILDTYLRLGRPIDAAAVDRVRQRVAELRLPGEVVGLLDRLPQGVEIALAVAEHTERNRVAKWFTEDNSWQELLRVAALAFAHELPERRFEEVYARLREIDRAEELALSAGVASPAPPGATTAGPLQERRNLYRDGGLVTRRTSADRVDDFGWAERRVGFVADGMREHVLHELYECGYRLWRPLRIWIDELAASGDTEVRLQLGLGMALLARNRDAAPLVRDMLVGWAKGRAGERFTATSVLSCMAADDALAPTALQVALSWADGAGQGPAVTAATALGGPLGIRYPTEAEPWLWHLSTRGKPIRELAVRSLGLLFCTAAADPQAATRLLKRLMHRLRRTLAQAPEPRIAGFATEAVIEVLSVEHLEHTRPVVAHLLRQQPAATEPLGILWAEALRSLPHRSGAIDALKLTLESLAGHEEAEYAVRELGAVLRRQLTEAECVRLCRELAQALRAPGDPVQTRPVIAALLAALAGGTPRTVLR
ncbi:hypothetical protein [Micromonospora cathayae]|uniref:HEAT repeat-containing protein n=1 Tax=Micromonospora cathayae TaxID=3028804 RepID=A0ABY7ZT02_9ACTN|nr:hypothetical protein [Micromonospora sp. HUAS 3]WDZ86008.1 hypothetical protein PVK37_06160 [Micromonospora sp. HUAS 3]